MYSKAESSRIRKEFWTTFGQYMKPVPSATGEKKNWQNYKTGVKDIYFRMNAEKNSASIGIELAHPDLELQQLFFDQFMSLRRLLESETGEHWNWVSHQEDGYGKVTSKIEISITGVNVMEERDWPELISFLKPRIIALDAFWANVKPAFED
jgi:hypothetical protein